MSGDVLEVRDLSVDVIGKRGEVSPIVRNVSFSVAPGKVLALIGESGSGKTTISLAIMATLGPGARSLTAGSCSMASMFSRWTTWGAS